MDDALRVGAVELREAIANPRAAADALRHQRKPIERALRMALAQRRGHMRKPRMEEESFGFRKRLRHRVQEAREHRHVQLHGAGSVEQRNDPKRLPLPSPELEVNRLAAARDRASQRCPQVDSPAFLASALPPRHARAHRTQEPFGKGERLFALRPGREPGEVLPGERFLRRRAALARVALGGWRIRRLRFRALSKSIRTRSARAGLEAAEAIRGSERRDRCSGALDAAPAPESVEQFVEALVFAPVGREQGFQRRPQPLGAIGERACDHPRSIACLAPADGKAGVAQRPGKAREPSAHAGAERRGTC